MATLREIREERGVVSGVGDFTTTLQQIAAGRMVRLRKLVLAAKRFADEAVVILRELELERTKRVEKELKHGKGSLASDNKIDAPTKQKTAMIVVTSDQGLCGSYNTEIIRKAAEVVDQYPQADYFVIGSKGQEYFTRVAKKII